MIGVVDFVERMRLQEAKTCDQTAQTTSGANPLCALYNAVSNQELFNAMQRIKTNGSAVLRTTQCAPAQVRHTRTAGRVGSDSSVLLFTRSLTRPHMLEQAQHATTRVATAHSGKSSRCSHFALSSPQHTAASWRDCMQSTGWDRCKQYTA